MITPEQLAEILATPEFCGACGKPTKVRRTFGPLRYDTETGQPYVGLERVCPKLAVLRLLDATSGRIHESYPLGAMFENEVPAQIG